MGGNIKTMVLSAFLAVFAMPSMAQQLDGDGFYRVQNVDTERYISIIDNTSYTQIATTSPDVSSLVTRKGFENISGDPSTVFYIEYKGTRSSDDNKYYDLQGQGTDIYEISAHYLYIRYFSAYNYYRAWAEESGQSFYISDEKGDYDPGYVSTNRSYKNWYILPVSSTGDNYFGISPTVEANGKYYATMYCGFPMQAISEGVKFYYICGVKNETAYYKEIDGVVPAKTPVLIECASSDPSENRVDMVTGSYTAISGNYLGGVMFHAFLNNHDVNATLYDEDTMRVLGTLSDGSIGFVKASASDFDDEALPANTAYLKVSSGEADELPLDDYTNGISEVTLDTDNNAPVYSLSGIMISDTTDGLPKGVYIKNNKKVVIK